jgi:hypothetical protein
MEQMRQDVENISTLSAEDRERLRNTSEDDLILFRHGFGTGLRNGFRSQLYPGLYAFCCDLVQQSGAVIAALAYACSKLRLDSGSRLAAGNLVWLRHTSVLLIPFTACIAMLDSGAACWQVFSEFVGVQRDLRLGRGLSLADLPEPPDFPPVGSIRANSGCFDVFKLRH